MTMNGTNGHTNGHTTVIKSSNEPDGVLEALGLTGQLNEGLVSDAQVKLKGEVVDTYCPSTGKVLAQVQTAHPSAVPDLVDSAHDAYRKWRLVPAPKRGEILREIRNELYEKKKELGALISLEMGKILQEGIGEVQEGIDICDYAIGLSRMLAGKVLPSERENHFLMETPSPLGVVLVVTAFNFPHAVFFWNFALSFICGNATIWKPSPTTPLVGIATMRIVTKVLQRNGLPTSLATLACGDVELSKALTQHPQIPLVSFTGSEKIGSIVGGVVQSRLGRLILELGGNNAVVVLPDANLDLALRTVLFGAVGTAGQRCTSTRRLFLHESIAEDFVEKLAKAYKQVRIGDPLEEGTLMGPVHSQTAVDAYNQCLEDAQRLGGKLVSGGKKYKHSNEGLNGGFWVEPSIVFYGAAHPETMEEETFAPILHVATFKTLEEAIELNNKVRQGLSSSLFTNDVKAMFEWCGAAGSDCGIVNVNQSTSGAEIGAGFGGNKATGWGRESGGDAWKQYCSWKSSTINFSGQLGLAQGIKFE
ncbi:NAD-aldehyde dehydrogenase [Cystobasidium minutum MCA 4210]|uniref:NAD-aldehyde dehydrogenase n=1 Tax=Cystobasidium minutum MCA 4210 TaxID=1397322 RepID=UPI0034CF9457|eukprot:jgi/Rhomi1/192437/gm1.651_g